jgi:hypothetical protein
VRRAGLGTKAPLRATSECGTILSGPAVGAGMKTRKTLRVSPNSFVDGGFGWPVKLFFHEMVSETLRVSKVLSIFRPALTSDE